MNKAATIENANPLQRPLEFMQRCWKWFLGDLVVEDGRYVRLASDRPARDDFERVLLATIAEIEEGGLAPRGALVHELTNRWFDRVALPWLTLMEAGVSWHWVVEAEVVQNLKMIEGDLIETLTIER